MLLNPISQAARSTDKNCRIAGLAPFLLAPFLLKYAIDLYGSKVGNVARYTTRYSKLDRALDLRLGENIMLYGAKSRLRISAIVTACLFLLSPAGYAKRGPVIETQLERKLLETIQKVRNGLNVTSRTQAAERLQTLTRGIDPQKVDDKTLSEMVSLLDTKEDSVRAWVAASLGNLGRRARVAVPRLLELLPEVDCLPGSLTSAPFIRTALKRMGETPPPSPNCDKKDKQ